MSIECQNTAIMTYLKTKGLVYHAKVLELREVIEGWLAYIPNTFPHYTRHTVRHSDEIVRQFSKLLFKDGDPEQVVLPLTAVEAYLLIVAAYLHDAGMVASDREKLELLNTDEWTSWVSGSNGGAKRWNEIQALRTGSEPSDRSVRDFLADLETRFLLAEFIRRTHHLRTRTVIEQHQAILGRFTFDDLVLQRSIADVCVAHGFRTHELEDQERFPDRRDIRGDAVNVRLMAILLRLGDLLDMSADRACPLLLNAACPLPADSLAHWTQYQRITHRLTAPDRIEITAECENQTEHRVLQDWCQWIVDEVRASRTLLSRSKRHHDYELPFAEIEGNDKTIIIRPTATANYFPSSWTFQLDQEAVFQRLIYDAYEGSEDFIRELIQNALDANRCQMYADLISQSVTPPQYPTEVSEEIRARYPMYISLKWIDIENPLSQEKESRQVLTVNDSGIGMDKDIIQRYFLQVGRSFYTTDEFRRTYRFVPTSRFGLGFLSTFAVSDFVNVETFKPSSSAHDGPIRLTLTGPRNYLLTERGDRRTNGTHIEVLLREPLKAGRLTELTSSWCRRVEFPVVVDDLGTGSTIVAETSEQFVWNVEDVTEDKSRLVVRAFPIERPGIEGELYVFAKVTQQGEAWDQYSWLKNRYPKMHPGAVTPEFPRSLSCLHGIRMDSLFYYAERGYSSRLDYRGEQVSFTLARNARNERHEELAVVARWEEILTEHLSTSSFSTSPDGWKYRQRLVEIFTLDSFWRSFGGMIPIQIAGKTVMLALKDVERFETLTFVLSKERVRPSYRNSKKSKPLPEIHSEMPMVLHDQLLSDSHRLALVSPRLPEKVDWLDEDYVALDLSLAKAESELFAATRYTRYCLFDLPITTSAGCAINWPEGRQTVLLNANHILVKWLERIKAARAIGESITTNQFEMLLELVGRCYSLFPDIRNLQNYLEAWSKLPGLSPDLYPPQLSLSAEMFGLPYWKSPE